MALSGLSHAGFNNTFDEVIVFTSSVCADLSGIGLRYFLEKVGGQWKIVSRRMT